MKKIIPIILFLFIISCERDFKEINTNPDTFSSLEPEYIFGGVVLRTIDLIADMNKRVFWSYSHYLSIEGGPFPRYSATPVSMNGWWDRFYIDILSNLNQIKVMYGEDPDYANRIQIVNIWQSYIYSIMVSMWGPVPYFETFDQSSRSYSYDSEPDIYTDILSTLKTASELLDEEGDVFTPDVIFGDDEIQGWKKFANTLRLKLALRISDVNPTLAGQHITELMANEEMLVSGEDEDVRAYWGTSVLDYSPYYEEYIFNAASPGVYPYLSHFLFLYLRSYGDPRTETFANPSLLPYVVADTIWVMDLIPEPDPNDTVAYLINYPIPYYGRPKTGRVPDVWHIEDPLPLPPSDYSYSDVHSQFLVADYYHSIISHVDVLFMKAEAALKGYGGSRTAEEYYYEGIEASFTQYGFSGDYNNYILQDGIAWETSAIGFEDFRGIVNSDIDGDPLKQIALQRWISNYFHGAHDAWCLQRRLRFLDLPPHFNPESPTTTNVLAADLPERLPYPANEDYLNHDEFAEAIDVYFDGDNDMNGLLYFSKEYEHTDWLNIVPRINNDVVRYMYGETFEELDAAGVEYEIIKAIKYRSID
ncbi:MAG: SusD/RagB family nutrient-binding outer membrane lipoprotein [Bacteroidales bacterium]|nr:SusD/RagB family nutrient-binding outer membrane lipoprotein [Bacteroidales bacterium]